jgi:NAD+ kinase
LTSKKLQLVVREPYTPQGERYRLRHALIPPGEALVVRSKVHEGKLFIDGPHQTVPIGFGDILEFTQASQSLTVLGISPTRAWGVDRRADEPPMDEDEDVLDRAAEPSPGPARPRKRGAGPSSDLP